ncbi:MAG: hypothetical protein KY395_06940 [Actinobacteria bacterium]|nr:hypothetical protein [Actinomycetota bacterium]
MAANKASVFWVAGVTVLVAALAAGPSVPVGAQESPPGESGCTVFDARGDTGDLGTTNPRVEDRADITQLCVDYGYALRVVVVVAQPTDPKSDPGWGDTGDSRVDFGFDTDDDADLELVASADGEDEVVVRDAANAQALCIAPFYALDTGYALEVSRNCLGADSVATTVRMVYDPAPAPTAGPLVTDTAPDTGFVPRVTRTPPAVPQPLADAAPAICSPDEENDTVDEAFQPVVFDAGDIVESCVQHGGSELRLTMRMRRPTDPQTEPIWRTRSVVAWDIDADNDLSEDFTALFTDTGVRLYAPDASDASDFCEGTPGFDGTLLIAHFPRPCLGSPGFVAVRPFSLFARVAQIEPDPPAAIDLFRFPGFGLLVGAPGATVPPQATGPVQEPTPPRNPVVPAPPPAGTEETGGTGQGVTVRTATGTATAPVVTQTSTSRLAVTGAAVVPIGWGLALTMGGALLVMASRRRAAVALVERGRWDVLPGSR